MKKILLGIGITLSLGLVGCGSKSNNENQIAEQSEKIEELEKKDKTLETKTEDSVTEEVVSLTEEEKEEILSRIDSELNKKVTSIFIEEGLPMYGNTQVGPGENPGIEEGNVDGIPPRLVGMSFYTEPQTGLIITIENFANSEDMNATIEHHKSDQMFDYEIVKNDNLKSIIFFNKNANTLSQDQELFNQYAEVFKIIE